MLDDPAATRRLVVLASFDPVGELSPHLMLQVSSWQGACEKLVVVTTSSLSDDARSWLSARSKLVERANYGYDFFSYKAGLDAAGDLGLYDEIVVCNDSYVGPLIPVDAIFDRMRAQPVDFWGLTVSDRVSPHVQSYFVVFRAWVIRSEAFQRFWSHMYPESDRSRVILHYEVGLSKELAAAGFTKGSYFVETNRERRLARIRVVWWAAHRRVKGSKGRLYRLRRHLSWAQDPWNPTYALADSALVGRLPIVKFDVLRNDPYGLGSERLLRRCETRYPNEFKGVRDYLKSTARYYPGRDGERLRPSSMFMRPIKYLLGYR